MHFRDSRAFSGFSCIFRIPVDPRKTKKQFFFQKLSHLVHYLEKLSNAIKVGIQKLLKLPGLEFSGFRIPELQYFPGFPDFRDPVPLPSADSAIQV